MFFCFYIKRSVFDRLPVREMVEIPDTKLLGMILTPCGVDRKIVIEAPNENLARLFLKEIVGVPYSVYPLCVGYGQDHPFCVELRKG